MGKFIRVRLLGTGTTVDPFRVPLPTYNNLILDIETPLGIGVPRWCLVELPDSDWLESEGTETAPVFINVPNIGQVIRQLDPAHRARIIQRIKDKYRERAASYVLNEQ